MTVPHASGLLAAKIGGCRHRARRLPPCEEWDMEKVGSLEYWNMRAETFGGSCGRNRYAESFLGRLGLGEGESVLDMGCATGTLAIPLARAGHPVMACDFSPRMIEGLMARAREEGVAVDAKVMAWEDDWDSFGVCPDCVDVAVASRSIARQDLRRCVDKLERVARRAVAITIPASPAPAFDPRLCAHLGRTVPRERLDAELFSLLCEKGRMPQVSYIPAARPMRFVDFDMALFELRKLAGEEPLGDGERALFEEYARRHFVLQGEGSDARYVLDYPLCVEWAFVTWNVGVSVRAD